MYPIHESDFREYYYDYDLIGAYIPLEEQRKDFEIIFPEIEEWNTCPRCNALPRVWVFNNGNYAACKCFKRYDKLNVEAEDIMSYLKRNNGSALGFDEGRRNLLNSWNYFTERMKEII